MGVDRGCHRARAMAALIVFIGIGWWVLRQVDDSERDWTPADLPIVNTAPDAPLI